MCRQKTRNGIIGIIVKYRKQIERERGKEKYGLIAICRQPSVSGHPQQSAPNDTWQFERQPRLLAEFVAISPPPFRSPIMPFRVFTTRASHDEWHASQLKTTKHILTRLKTCSSCEHKYVRHVYKTRTMFILVVNLTPQFVKCIPRAILNMFQFVAQTHQSISTNRRPSPFTSSRIVAKSIRSVDISFGSQAQGARRLKRQCFQ